MCKLVDFTTNYGTVCKVADIKIEYINHILKSASVCSEIEKIVLFGSTLEERCKDISDIDIAIFGNQTESCFLKSKQFEQFERELYGYGNFQDYDILYFQNGKKQNAKILEDIQAGKVIYRKGMA